MTIAAGFVCGEGVLLCADTEQTAWAMKLHGSKVGHFDCPGGTITFAYAGHTSFAWSAIQKCQQRLQSVPPEDTIRVLEQTLEREYRRHVLKHPDHATDGALQYSLLLAVWSPMQPTRLYVTSQTAMQMVDGYECIGMGDYLAHYLIRPTFLKGLPYRRVLPAVAYAFAQIKDYVPNCGGLSVFMFLRNDGKIGITTSAAPGLCAQIEKHAKGYDFVTGELFGVLNEDGIEDSQFEQYAKTVFVQRLMSVRRELSDEWLRRQAKIAEVNPHLSSEEVKQVYSQISLGFTPEPREYKIDPLHK